jgi:hypothetical protein
MKTAGLIVLALGLAMVLGNVGFWPVDGVLGLAGGLFGLVIGLMGGLFGLAVGLVAGVFGAVVGVLGALFGLGVAVVVLALPLLIVAALAVGVAKLVALV